MEEHDLVIDYIQKTLGGNQKYSVVANPSTAKNYVLQGLFPDIIVKSRQDDSILFIIEVETADSISSSALQWKNYSILPGIMYIIVPEAQLNYVKTLVSTVGIKARFGYYQMVNGKVVKVHYE